MARYKNVPKSPTSGALTRALDAPKGTVVTMSSDLSLLDDNALVTAATRAWREASRSWGEYRRQPSGDIGRMLLTSAEAAEEWWAMLRDEQEVRLDDGSVEVRSSDTYLTGDSFVSPWVRNAKDAALPYHIEGGSSLDDEPAKEVR